MGKLMMLYIHIMELTLVEQKYNFMKDFHEIHIVIAVLLHLDQQSKLRSALFAKWKE